MQSQTQIPMAKGSNLLGLLYAVENRFGAATREQLLATVPPEIGEPLRRGAVTMASWFPLEWYKALHRTSQQLTGRDPQLARELAHLFVTHQLGGIYRALLSLISPHWLFMYPGLIFSRYFSVGKLEIPENRAGYVLGRWSGCRGFDRNIWNATFGGCQAALERAGAKGVDIKVTAGGGDTDESAEAVGTWR